MMKRICIALCFSLFASLIHAASMTMPFEATGQTHSEHVVQHECHTQSDAPVENSNSMNHQAQHQCCLGVVANLFSNQHILPDLSGYFFSEVPQLIVEAVPNHIFKPPRKIS